MTTVAAAGLTPVQQRVVDSLFASGTPRPTFDSDLRLRLLDALEGPLAEWADRLGPDVLYVRKADLARIHQCERHHQAEDGGFPGWTPANALGTVAHKAIELSVTWSGDATPAELADAAIERIVRDGDDYTPRSFLLTASPAELAELRAGVTERVAGFQECFPPLAAQWRPRLGAPLRVELCADRIVLQGRPDLGLGRAVGNEARCLLVDFKTGRAYPAHADDLRYYSLLHTIKTGVPPFRAASYYLDSGTWKHEDVTEGLLLVAVRRVVDGVRKLAELRLGDREPSFTPGPACTYCSLKDSCEGARQWEQEREERGLTV